MAIFSRSEATQIPAAPDRWRAALEAALRVSEIAASATALPEAVHAMVATATRLLGADQGSIMLLEDGGRVLTLVAADGLVPEVTLGTRVPADESVAGRVLTTGQPMLLGQVDREAFVNFIPKTRPVATSVVVPLRVQGRAIGVLNLGKLQGPPFADDDMRVAQMFGDQAAGLIHRARLHEQAEHRSSELMALVESSRGLMGTLDIESLLQQVLDGAARLSGSTDGFACLFDADSGALSRGVFRGLDKDAIREVIADEQVRAAIDSPDVAILATEKAGNLVAVGLVTPRSTRGLVVVTTREPLPPSRVDLLRAFAQQCAGAIGAAELHSKIEQKESELASIIHGVPNPIILVDSRGLIAAVNPAAEQLFGVSTVFSAGAPAEGTIGHAEVERFLSAQGELQGEVLVGSPPKTYKVRVTDVKVPGAPMGRVLIMDDITSEREMVQTQRDFVAMIGHELRTPLTIIKGFARTLLRRVEKATPSEVRDAVNTIDGKAAQLERLIEDLLYVSKIESREASLRIENVDITALVNAVGTDVIQQHTDREILIDVKQGLTWPCDETKVGLVLRHLIENGLKYSQAPTPVTVRAVDDADTLRIDVIDKGMGLISSDIPHIFDRFRQVDGSSTREHGGTGVGLYLCAQLVRVHEGRIWVDSTWGKGSTFSFSLPRRALRSEVVRLGAARVEKTA